MAEMTNLIVFVLLVGKIKAAKAKQAKMPVFSPSKIQLKARVGLIIQSI